MSNEYPSIIKEVGFDFSWDERKVWKLSISETEVSIQELLWHFDIPFLWINGGRYNLTPRQVLDNPETYEEEIIRVRNSDIFYPIDVMEKNGRLVILDGLHRLMKHYILMHDKVIIRKIPSSEIPKIIKT